MSVPDVSDRPQAAQPWLSSHRRLLSLAAIAAAGSLVVGLATGADHHMRAQLEETCGSLLTVINPEGAEFDRMSSDVNSGKGIVRMLYGVNRPGDAGGRRSVIVCAFGTGTVMSSVSPELIAASVDGRTIGPARIALLNRFWLGKGPTSG
jgi:hypothetical protein